MPLNIHFITGLPRSGTTLLAAILRQNPKFRASMESPLYPMFSSLVKSMSGASEASMFISQKQRERVLQGLIERFYEEDCHSEVVVFDNSRAWTSVIAGIAKLFPNARLLCCVRSPAWILDSFERHVQRNCLEPSRIFNHESGGTVYSRVHTLVEEKLVGLSLKSVRTAWFGEHASRLLAIPYNSLTTRPAETIKRLYEVLGQTPFAHDFQNLDYSEPEFDKGLGLPGFHTVSPSVENRQRDTILPPEIFAMYNKCFWEASDQNPRNVEIL